MDKSHTDPTQTFVPLFKCSQTPDASGAVRAGITSTRDGIQGDSCIADVNVVEISTQSISMVNSLSRGLSETSQAKNLKAPVSGVVCFIQLCIIVTGEKW